MKSLALGLILALALSHAACGDDTGTDTVSPERSSLTATPVRYDATGVLRTDLVVTLKDPEGNPVEGVRVVLQGTGVGTAPDVSPREASTDANGTAAFPVERTTIGQVEFMAQVPDAKVVLGPLTVDFALDVQLGVQPPELVPPGAVVRGTVTVSDGEGPVAGLHVRLIADPEPLALDPEEAVTDESGKVPFRASFDEETQVEVLLEVSGLQGRISVGSFLVAGPVIRGTVSGFPPGGVVENPRVGLLYLDMITWQSVAAVGTPQELVSAPLDFDDNGRATFELRLPIRVPEDHLTSKLTGSPHLLVAPYLLVAYDGPGSDLETMDASDLLVGWNEDLPTVMFVAAAEGQTIEPPYHPGYMFVTSTESGGEIQDWDQWADHMDLEVNAARVPEVDLPVEVGCPSCASPADWTVAVYLLNLRALSQAQPGTWPFSPDYSYIIDSAQVTLTQDATTQVTLHLGRDVESTDFANWSVYLGSLQVKGLYLVAYHDRDGNGELDPTDPFVLPSAPWSEVPPDIWYVLAPYDWALNFVWPDFHAGYALVRHSAEFEIAEVRPAIHTLVLTAPVERGHTSVRYQIWRPGTGGQPDMKILAGDDLATTPANERAVVTMEDLSQVQAGDILVITETVDGLAVEQFDKPLKLEARE